MNYLRMSGMVAGRSYSGSAIAINRNSNKMASALVAITLAAGTLVQAQVQPTTTTATNDPSKTEHVKMEKFEVTGSRIKRLDTETPQPVVTFSSEEIKMGGFTSLGDFVQSLPFNTGSTNSIVQTASFTRGAATVNPRGLGSNRFLVLINGRRSVGYALTNSNNQSVFDFNSIPLAAIDEITYLKDGASAIYGSDAVSGVMDIKLKRNYSGLRVDLLGGNTLGHDTFTKEASVLVGAQTGKTSIVMVASYVGANDNFIRDFDRSKTTDYSSYAPKGTNQNSSANWPANLILTAAQAAAAGFTTGSGNYVLTGGKPTANPTKSQFARAATLTNENRYDFAQTYQLFPPFDYYGVYTNIKHEISDSLYFFGEIIYSNNQTNFSFTPSVIQSTQNAGTGPTGLLNIPATNPYNPLGIDITNFLYRTSFGPARKFDTKSSAVTYLMGVGGNIDDNWSWEVGASLGRGDVSTTARNQIRAVDLQRALNGTTRQTALNPFGPSDNQSLVDSLFTVSNSVYAAKAEMLDATVTGNLFELPGGDIGVAIGSEYRKEMIQQDPDTSAYVGSGGGTPYRGDRTIFSAYVEATFPITRQLEVQAAGRFEDYSDFGTTTKPKIAAKFKLPPTKIVDVLLRASFSQSFKAPDMGRLFTAATTAFTSTTRTDPKRPQDPATQLRIITSGNADLQPEESNIWYGGAVLDVTAVKGLSFAVDYFNIEMDDVISSPSDTTLLAREDQFPGAVVRDNTQGNPGPILYLRRVPFNVAKQWYSGVDFEAKYNLRDTRFGEFLFTLNTTRTISIKSNSGIRDASGNLPDDFENVGLYNNPKWNGAASASWAYKDYGAAVRVNYIGAYFNDAYTVDGWGENAVTTVNAQFSYKGFWDTKATIGVNNVFDKEPPFNGFESSSYDQGTYGRIGLGRFVYLRLEKEF